MGGECQIVYEENDTEQWISLVVMQKNEGRIRSKGEDFQDMESQRCFY